MRLSHVGAQDKSRPWSPDRMAPRASFSSSDASDATPKGAELASEPASGVCLRAARSLGRKLPRFETPKRREMRKMQEAFVREFEQMLVDEKSAEPVDLSPLKRGSQRGDTRSDAAQTSAPSRTSESLAPGPLSPSDSPALHLPAAAVRDMFAAVYDDDIAQLGSLVNQHPDVILGSWEGMSVLRYAIMVHPKPEQTQCLMLLLNRFTLLHQRHGKLTGVVQVFADALATLCDKPHPERAELAMAVCFENYIVAHGPDWIGQQVERLAGHAQPVATSLHLMTDMASEALGAWADLPAVQSLCQVWAVDLAMMAAAASQKLAPISPTLCGRGHQVAKALQNALQGHARPPLPLHAALQNMAPVLRGNNTGHKLLELAMVLDQSAVCTPFTMRSASSV